MKTTCIINNYNYDQYITAAIESAVNQTVKFDEIIIVDDGSTDNSKDLIAAKCCGNVTAVFKKNEGQLSAFNYGFVESTGELICFLDADDAYEATYLESLKKLYAANAACDFTFSAYKKFGAVEKTIKRYSENRDLGMSVVLANQKMAAIGGPTSTISMKRSVATKILPYQFVEEWITRADDILIWGSSLVGAHKFFHADPLVCYRVHATNLWHGKAFSADVRLKRALATKKFFAYLRTNMGYGTNISDLAHHEFRTNPKPSLTTLIAYIAIINNGVAGFMMKLKYHLKIVAHFISTR